MRDSSNATNASPVEQDKTIKMTCRKAMWWGSGAPAGTCDEPAYGPESHMRAEDGWWTSPGLARCPRHGGPTIEEFHQWLMKQILK